MSATFPTIVLDLDGTLIETAPDLCAALNHALAEAGRAPVPLAGVRSMIGDGARAMLHKGLSATGGALPEAEMAHWFDVLLEHYGRNIAEHSHAFPGVPEVLEDLAQAGLKLGVCTNKPVALSLELFHQLGLRDRFQAILGGDSLPVRKPDPGHILGTLAAMGVAPARAVMVGDSANDVNAARNAGIPVVVVSFGYTTTPAAELGADALIDHFHELPAALAALA